MTPKQLHTLRHMLGINTPFKRKPEPYRNYAAVPPEDKEFKILEQIGAVERYHNNSQYNYYRCTETGKAAAIASFKTIRHPKGKRVYHKFLITRESLQDLTFYEFITNQEFKSLIKDA